MWFNNTFDVVINTMSSQQELQIRFRGTTNPYTGIICCIGCHYCNPRLWHCIYICNHHHSYICILYHHLWPWILSRNDHESWHPIQILRPYEYLIKGCRTLHCIPIYKRSKDQPHTNTIPYIFQIPIDTRHISLLTIYQMRQPPMNQWTWSPSSTDCSFPMSLSICYIKKRSSTSSSNSGNTSGKLTNPTYYNFCNLVGVC